MGKIEYTESQRAVIDTRNANILVSAAAGSGKTAVLTERIKALITDPDNPVDIDRMLIVTFTKAAAAEMRERIGRVIADYSAEHPEDKRMDRQLALLHNAQITTIDSFCLYVVKNNYADIGLDPGFRILDEGEKKLIRQDVLNELLERELEEGQEDFMRFLSRYSRDGRLDAVKELLLAVYEFALSHPDPVEWLKKACLEEMDTESALVDRRWYSWLKTRAEESLKLVYRSAKEAESACLSADGPKGYQELATALKLLSERVLAAQEPDERKRLLETTTLPKLGSGKKKNEDVQLREKTKAKITTAREQLASVKGYYAISGENALALQEKIADTAAVLLRLVTALDEAFGEAKRERNVLDFQDMEHLALKILLCEEEGKMVPSSAAMEYRDFFSYVFVDEYQDSNYVQEYVLKSICREDNYFMVGDVKQSVYRFRLARPEIFLEKYERFAPTGINRRIDLNKNFRSRKEVVDFVNLIFRAVMNKESCGMDYDENAMLYLGADYPEMKSRHYETRLLSYVAQKGDDKIYRECCMVADRIRSMMRDGFPVYDRDNKCMRELQYRDIVLLARSVKAYEKTLRRVFAEYDIPLYIGSQEGYFTTREVQCVLNALGVIDNPKQDIPLYDTLRHFLKLFSDKEMAALRIHAPESTLYRAIQLAASDEEFDEGLRAKAAEFIRWQEKWSHAARVCQVREILEGIFLENHYLETVTALPNGQQRKANLLLLMEKAADYENTSYLGLFSFLRYIAQLREQEVDYGEAGTIDENADVVRIMTIHKSKGLEFPVCICMGLYRNFVLKENCSYCSLDTDLGIALDVIDPEARLQVAGLKKEVLKQKLKEDALAEEMRILYVALTRAKEKLIITNVSEETDEERESEETIEIRKIREAKRAMDWIIMALEAAGSRPLYEEIVKAEDLEENIVEEAGEASGNLKNLMEEELPEDPEIRKLLSTEQSRIYPHPELSGLYTKTSVSELKKAAYGDEEAWEMFTEEKRTAYIPRFIKEEEKGRGAQRGTAYHKVLELIPYEKVPENADKDALISWLSGQGEVMVKGGRIAQEELALVDFQKIAAFVSSSLGQRMCRAAAGKKLKCEQPFFMGVKASEMDASFPDAETIIVQGVIDVYFEEEDGLVLLDYKTDRVIEEGELVHRYLKQIEIYARALHQITGKKIKEGLIYSFALEKTILCDIKKE